MGGSGGGRERPPRSKVSLLQKVRFFLSSVSKVLLMVSDPTSVFKASVHIAAPDRKVSAWKTLRSSGCSVEQLKVIGKTVGGPGCTINDILMTVLTGALSEYARGQSSRHQGGAPVPQEVTACVWVSLSPLSHVYKDFDELPLKWGNSTLGGVYIPLPMEKLGSKETLERMRAHTNDPSLPIESGVASMLMHLIGWMPPAIMKPLWPVVAYKSTVSMSNVPGPHFPLEWCGMPLRTMLFFVPPAGILSVFVTMITYNGELSVGMSADGTLLTQEALEQIVGELFEHEIAKLRDEAGRTSIIE